MKYKFYQFTLDDKKQTLSYDGGEGKDQVNIDITKINYQVLLFFIQHQSEVITKDLLIDAVWQGKMVTDNSIDQSISKIRKSLAQFDDRVVIKTVYGKGLEFAAAVTTEEGNHQLPPSQSNHKPFNWVTWTALSALVLMLFWQFAPQLINQPKASNQIPVMWLGNENNSHWFDQSSRLLLNQIFSNNGQNYLLNSDKKPKQLSNQEYIENYWRIYPELEIIKTDLQKQDDTYTLNLEVETQSSAVTESFNGSNLLKVLTDANLWLIENSGLSDQQSNTQKLLPQDSHVLELYMRSLHAYAQGELDQALNYIQLAIDQEPSLALAQLHLAQVQYAQGQAELSLATLDQLKKSSVYNQLEITAQSLRGDILDTAGKYQEAINIYQSLLNKYPNEEQGRLLPVKFNLSYSLTSVQLYQEALNELDEIIAAMDDQFDLDLVAHAWHKKGSVLLQIGQSAAAKQAADLAYQHFHDLSDMMSSAKVSILLARIANHEANYQQAADYLQQAIGVYRQADFPLGVGAALNELIYILMVNGQFTQAWTHMLEMKQIALQIDYFAMLMAAKEYEFEIARNRKQWVQAEAGLADYLRLATDNDFVRGISKHRLFELDLALDQGQTDRASPLINTIQQHIENSGEARLKPRLNIQQAKLYFLQNKPQSAVDLLNQSKALAMETEDMEAIHSINNELLEHYLQSKDYPTAQIIIDAVARNDSQPLAYPYLLLKSKTYYAIGENEQAIELAKQCKSKANEFWQSADEQYLLSLE